MSQWRQACEFVWINSERCYRVNCKSELRRVETRLRGPEMKHYFTLEINKITLQVTRIFPDCLCVIRTERSVARAYRWCANNVFQRKAKRSFSEPWRFISCLISIFQFWSKRDIIFIPRTSCVTMWLNVDECMLHGAKLVWKNCTYSYSGNNVLSNGIADWKLMFAGVTFLHVAAPRRCSSARPRSRKRCELQRASVREIIITCNVNIKLINEWTKSLKRDVALGSKNVVSPPGFHHQICNTYIRDRANLASINYRIWLDNRYISSACVCVRVSETFYPSGSRGHRRDSQIYFSLCGNEIERERRANFTTRDLWLFLGFHTR